MTKNLSIRQIYKLTDKLLAKLEDQFSGGSLTGDSVFRLAGHIEAVLKRGVDRQTIYQSLLPLLGMKMTQKFLEETARRLVGNLDRLSNMRPVLPWDGQPSAEWCAAEVLSIQLVPTRRRGEVGQQVLFRLHTGLPAGLLSRRVWSRPALGVLATELGFSRARKGKILFEDPGQLVGLHCEVLVNPAPDRRGNPEVSRARASSGQKTYNRRIFHLREQKNDRGTAYPCPHQITQPCHRCPVGYVPVADGEPVCDLATHPRTYRLGQCMTCNETKFFDPNVSLLDCVRCHRRKVYSGET